MGLRARVSFSVYFSKLKFNGIRGQCALVLGKRVGAGRGPFHSASL